ncbi:FAD/NAD(P)-binding domain-containing protein [Mycena crocata]|nr:FAD/NAD(P)-binding domain-containing protein [Mycena crocata]
MYDAQSPDVTAPLTIFIVGAGLGGLAAAVSLRHQGHAVMVEIFESSRMNKELGAAITAQANAIRVLEFFGYDPKNLDCVPMTGIRSYNSLSGESPPFVMTRPAENMGWMCHRADLHSELKRLALGNDGNGPPETLHLGVEVVACDPGQGTLTPKNGDTRQAVLIIGADGIHIALPSGVSAFRFLFPSEKLQGVCDMEWFTAGDSGGRIVLSPEERYNMLFLSSCRHSEIYMAIILFPFALPLLPTWINGRTALLGDAAHAMLPLLGQGGGMALEDAATIGLLLPLGTRRDDIPARLQAYEVLASPAGSGGAHL